MTEKPVRQTRKIDTFDDRLTISIPLKSLDRVVLGAVVIFLLLVLGITLLQYETTSAYLLLRTAHNHFGRYMLAVAGTMFGIATYIGIIRHADVTPYFRRATYVVFGSMLVEGAMGAALYFIIGARPGEDVHILYGIGTMLALPFFIYVERTAPKRPAMGSYMWGFGLLAGIIVRCLSTGPV